MNTMILCALLATADAPGAALAQAYKRELALLDAERVALEAARAQIEATRVQRTKEAKRKLASLEAQLVTEHAKNDAAATRIAALERAATQEKSSLDPAVASARALLGKRGIEGTDVTALLSKASSTLERESVARRTEGMFFGADGSMLNGVIVDVGAIGAVAAGERGAGALVHVPNSSNLREILASADANDARAFVDDHGAFPLVIGAPSAALAAPTQIERVSEAGTIGWGALVTALLALGGAIVRALWLVRVARHTRGIVDKATGHILAGDTRTAETVCRTAGGAAGKLWSAVVASSATAPDDVLEDIAADGLVEGLASIERGDRAIVGIGILSVVLGALIAVESKGAHIAPLESALALGVASIAGVTLARILGDRLQRDLERGAIRLVEAVRRAREASSRIRPEAFR